jgi:hypothetical protein
MRDLIYAGAEFGSKREVEDELFFLLFFVKYKYYETKNDMTNIAAGVVVTYLLIKIAYYGFESWQWHFLWQFF